MNIQFKPAFGGGWNVYIDGEYRAYRRTLVRANEYAKAVR
jgi:hypothetical protein